MVIQLMKERERRFHILPPGSARWVRCRTGGSHSSVVSSFTIVGDTGATVATGQCYAHSGAWCRLPTAGWRTRDQRPGSASAHRQPRPRGRLERAGTQCSVPASGPWSNMSPDPPQRPHRQDGSSHCLMVKHLFAGRILARPRVCCDRMKARAEVNISMPSKTGRVGPLQTADCCCCSRAVMILLAERG